MTAGEDPNANWCRCEALVLSELQRLNTAMTQLNCEVVSLKVDLAAMKGRAGVWGSVAGGAVSILATLLAHVFFK
jgi:hypothetical protein